MPAEEEARGQKITPIAIQTKFFSLKFLEIFLLRTVPADSPADFPADDEEAGPAVLRCYGGGGLRLPAVGSCVDTPRGLPGLMFNTQTLYQ